MAAIAAHKADKKWDELYRYDQLKREVREREETEERGSREEIEEKIRED